MSLKILTQKEFDAEIKQLQIKHHPITMIDAILEYCMQKDIEVETAASLITPRMKATIECEAMKLKMIAQKARLPIGVDE
jgi:diketogulonate reductase-like aldo/keto reductase